MPKIVVKRKAEIYKEMPIRPFQNRITIGSEGDNDLIISDKKVSMHHLLIEKEGTDYYVLDTDSAFGTFVNGSRIDNRTLLSNGDEIAIGDHTLKFENVLFNGNDNGGNQDANGEEIETLEYTEPSSVSANEDMKVLKAIEIKEKKTVLEKTDAATAQASKGVPYYLVAIYGPYIGKKYQLNSDITKIGRDKTLNDIVIRENTKGEVDPSVSRRHASIFFENGALYITDKRSKTRTHVNQNILDEDSVVQLMPGDEIEIRSDQKSTIFRLVKEGTWDYMPPKKAGDWWIRNSSQVIKIASAVVIILALIGLFSSIKSVNVKSQKPSTLKVIDNLWFAESDPLGTSNLVEDIQKQSNVLTPAAGDLNGDGYNDLVYIDKLGYLFTLDGNNKQPLWSSSSKYRIQNPLHFLLEDLNGDDLPDIILPSDDSRIYAIDGRSGTEIWSSPLIGGEFSGAPVIADINGDRIKDILLCNARGELYIGYGTYSEPKWSNSQTNSIIKSTPAAGDFDGDGISEIAIGTDQGEILIFSGLSNKVSKIIDVNEEFQKAKGTFFEDHQIRRHIAIGDLDGDHCDDIAFTSSQGNVLAISGSTFRRLWHDELSSEKTFSEDMYYYTAMGDLDGDKKQDVVVFTPDNKIIAYRGIGTSGSQRKVLWGFMPENQEYFISQPALADINKDRFCDVIAASSSGGIYIFDGRNGKLMWQQEENQQKAIRIISTPIIADFNGDKSLDICVRHADEKFYIMTTNAIVPKNVLWWSQVNYNAAQTGSFHLIGLDATGDQFMITLSSILVITVVVLNGYTIMNRRKQFLV